MCFVDRLARFKLKIWVTILSKKKLLQGRIQDFPKWQIFSVLCQKSPYKYSENYVAEQLVHHFEHRM